MCFLSILLSGKVVGRYLGLKAAEKPLTSFLYNTKHTHTHLKVFVDYDESDNEVSYSPV